jgi:hypothetical protein
MYDLVSSYIVGFFVGLVVGTAAWYFRSHHPPPHPPPNLPNLIEIAPIPPDAVPRRPFFPAAQPPEPPMAEDHWG